MQCNRYPNVETVQFVAAMLIHFAAYGGFLNYAKHYSRPYFFINYCPCYFLFIFKVLEEVCGGVVLIYYTTFN